MGRLLVYCSERGCVPGGPLTALLEHQRTVHGRVPGMQAIEEPMPPLVRREPSSDARRGAA